MAVLTSTFRESSAWTRSLTLHTSKGPRGILVSSNKLGILSQDGSIKIHPLFGTILDAAILDSSKEPFLVVTCTQGFLSFLRLNLDSGSFSSLQNTNAHPDRFELVHQFQIAPPGLNYTSPGQKISVDPLSRAMAVFAHQTTFAFFVLDPTLASSSTSSSSASSSSSSSAKVPFSREYCITVREEGWSFWDAVFLYPDSEAGAGRLDVVTLAVVVCKNGIFSIIIYEYKKPTPQPPLFKTTPANHLTKYGPFPLPSSLLPTTTHALPTHPLSFLLFTDTLDMLHITHTPTTPSTPQTTLTHTSQTSLIDQIPLPPTSTSTYPLITSLAQTPSQNTYILATDSGHILTLTLTNPGNPPHVTYITRRNHTSHLTHLANDVYILIGDMCPGEVLSISLSTKTVTRVCRIENTAPVLDVVVSRGVGYVTSGDVGVDGVVAVYAGVVVLFGRGGGEEQGRWVPDDGESITCAAGDEDGVLVVSLGARKEVVVLRVGVDVVVEVSRTSVGFEPSTLGFDVVKGRKVVFVGTYEPAVLVLEVDDVGLSFGGVLELGADNGGWRIPNSICVIRSGGEEVLAIGLRDGTALFYVLAYNVITSSFGFKLLDTIKVGLEPIRFIPTRALLSDSHILVLSDKVWRASLIENESTLTIELNYVCIDNVTNVALLTSSTTPPTYIFSTPTTLSFISIDITSSVIQTIRHSHSLSKPPRRIIHDHATNTLIVACNKRESGSAEMTGEIKLVDPETGVQYLREMLPKGESCYSMTVWNIKDQKRYICIGTAGYREAPGVKSQGRVLVYSLKEVENKSPYKPPYKIKKLGEYKLPELVFAVCSFMKSYLLVASGNCLYQLKIEAESRALHCGAKVELRYPIRSLSVSGSNIFVGGANDSVSLYSFEPRTKQFTFCRSDDLTRTPSDCLSLSTSKVLVADKSGELYCLTNPTPNTDRSQPHIHFKTSFCVNLGETITRLHAGQMDTGFEVDDLGICSIQEDEDMEEPDTIDDGVKRAKELKTVYAVSILGSVFSVRGLKEESVERWKALQDVLSSFPATRPLLGNDYMRYRSTASHGMQNVVDGDLIRMYELLSEAEKQRVVDEWRFCVGLDDEVEAKRWVETVVRGLRTIG
ncbi:hypothetical protein BCR33DRAFT_765729 [Rhizoclosmatium globosum]|uniref:DNA damage-binding protein 1 n=1 Tax=Rhizoclosmatium globosum TaxID=329046 RepID=A0A1Y2CE74_9FUNG|nr:hypothetical protein BCR33DRAFT_765729 [Rhizoclosmatium globosum]|eukprot:ORY45343.1 hypothetical protein BCR33DRAFT_765729 [Rhizoclosmatium globosum]